MKPFVAVPSFDERRQGTLGTLGVARDAARHRERRFHLGRERTRPLRCALSAAAFDRAPRLIAAGEKRFSPRVAAAGQIYLGYHRRAFGYRFLHLARRNGKAVDYAMGPWS